MNYQLSEYRRRVLGCFLGKNAGGTLGMRDECEKKVRFTVHNRYKTSENFRIVVYPDGRADLRFSPSAGFLHVPEGVWLNNRDSVSFTFSFGELSDPVVRAVAEFTTPSRAGVMLVSLFFVHNLNEGA